MTGIDEATADRVFRLRLMGGSPRVIASEFNVSIGDINRIVDERMVRVDAAYRARAFSLDLERLELMTLKCIDQINKGSMAAMHLALKICERRSAMLGLDAPQRVDVLEIAAPTETSTGELRRVFDELRSQREAEEAEANPSLPN